MDKFGIGLSKYNNINQLALWTDYKIKDLKFKFNTIIKDTNNKLYYDTSIIFKYSENINIGGLISINDFNIDKFILGCDLKDVISFENIQLNYTKTRDNTNELESYFNFNLDHLNFQNYLNYFNDSMHDIIQVERTL